jgi:hypothetical protein
VPKSTSRSVLGLAVETTTGTAKPPTVFIPVTQITPKDNVTQLVDKGMRGSMVDAYDVQAGTISGSFDFDGDVFLDSIGYMLAGIMGDVVETGSSSPYTHTFALLNSGNGQPVSQTLTDFYAAGTRAYAGAMYSELDFKLSPDALLTYSAKTLTYGSATASQPTPAFGSVPALAAWRGAVTIGGTPFTEVLDLELNIKRQVTVIKAVDNSQQPFSIWAGPMAVEGKATLIMEDDTYLTQYLGAAKTSLDVTLAVDANNSLDFHMTKVNWTSADITRGKDYIELPVAFKAYANTTDVGASAGYGPLVVTLKNSIATGLY